MSAESRNTELVAHTAAKIDKIIAELARALGHTQAAIDLAGQVTDGLAAPIQSPVKHALNAPVTRAEILAARRRAHKPGTPPKIESDPELEAFILARVDCLTFKEIAAQVGAAFSPDRRVAMSSVDRWWKRSGRALAANRHRS